MKTQEQNAPSTDLAAVDLNDAAASAVPTQEQPVEVNTDQVAEVENEEEGQLTIDVYQTPDDVVLLSTIAGVKIIDLEVTLNNDLLTIRGARKNPSEDVKADDYYYQENYWGKFSRSVILPVDIEADKVKAELKDGILKVLLPKATRAKTKKIRVINGK